MNSLRPGASEAHAEAVSQGVAGGDFWSIPRIKSEDGLFETRRFATLLMAEN